MYLVTIKNDGFSTVIHDPTTSEVKLESASISKERNKFDSLSFTMYPDNPGWGQINPFSTAIEVLNLQTGRTEFEGRVLMPVPEMSDDGDVSVSVTCEGVMAYLCDSHQSYEPETHWADEGGKSGLQRYLEKLLETHNERVEEEKRIYPGEITLQTFETSGGVTKQIDRDSTWNNINSKLIEVFGGEMTVRRGDDGLLYLDYKEKLGTTRTTRIEIARNMASGRREISPDSVITRLYPYGAKVKSVNDEGEEEESEERIGIESVNNGVPYIDDAVAIEQYGIIEGYNEWDDVEQPSNLLTKAQEWLGQNNAMPVSHTFKAIDLSYLGLDVDEFRIYDSYPCWNPLIGLDETLEIVKQTIDITSPEESTFDMGDTSYTLSKTISASQDIVNLIESIESTTKTSIININNKVSSSSSSIEIVSDQITQVVSQQIADTNKAVQTISEQIQSFDGWEYNFTEISEAIDELGTYYSEQTSYIRFVDGEIWLGKDPEPGEDDFKLVISNDKLRFLQNNVEVAYFSNKRLYITDARITNRLEIGSFAIFPRENGNMTIRYMG